MSPAVVAALSLVAAAALLALALPRLVGVGLAEIGATLAAVPLTTVALLVVLWVGGLWAYTIVVVAALPGLGHSRAFALNAVGGAASNLLPFGGAVGAVVTYAMARSWGHGRHAVLTATIVSNACNVLGRLVLPAVGLGVLLLAGHVSDPLLTFAAAVGCGVSAVGTGLFVAGVRSAAVAEGLGRALDATAARLLPRRLRPAAGATARGLHRLRAQIGDTVRRRWGALLMGMAATFALQAVLFAACLHVTGAWTELPVALAAFAVSRVLTVVVLTPNGVGLSETGTAGVLVALGTPAAPAAASVLLFGLITHLFEIVLGLLAGAVWAARHRALERV
jgi:uncharacterized membrane protein YbhN (UPF0104 family)